MPGFLYIDESQRGLKSFPTHSHAGMWEIVVYQRGSGVTRSAGDSRGFTKGTIACHPPSVPHSDHARVGTYETLSIFFDHLDFPRKKMTVLQDEGHAPFLSLATVLLHEHRLKRDRWEERCDNLADLLLAYLAGWKKEPFKHPAVQRVEQILSENIPHCDFKILTALRAVGKSPFHLMRLFHKQTGKSPRQYLLELRLRTATDLLSKTDISIHRVAALSGFGDPHYFSRIFSRRKKMTPKKLRQKNKSGWRNVSASNSL